MAAHPPGEFVATSVLASPWQRLGIARQRRFGNGGNAYI
jgi:hypothetical protein